MFGNSFTVAEFAAIPISSNLENVPGLTAILTVIPSYFADGGVGIPS
jgi:hypothetical protein